MNQFTLTGENERFGLSLRFDVEIDGHNLGGWQQCSGLEVDFKPTPVKEMGENTSIHQLRGAAEYQAVTLTRAIMKDRWNSTRQWLADVQTSQAPQTAVITLRNAWNEDVASWSLQNVIPIKWKGPSLDATQSHVATETLTLAHEGFEDLALPHANVSRAKLSDEQGNEVVLQFNPGQLKREQSRTPRFQNIFLSRYGKVVSIAGKEAQTPGASPSNAGSVYENGQLWPCRYTLSNVVFDSYYHPDGQRLDINKLISLLFTWMEPSSQTRKPTLLTFEWGHLHDDPVFCTLATSSVTYTRLESDGTPSRATVSMTLNEQGEIHTGTNPTSGGPGGHRSRVLVADESLAAVAFQEYGDASVWPLLASFNDIDDPTRLKPGTAIQVPPMPVLARC